MDSSESYSLKEWSTIVTALARGDFCALIRKGGIREQRAGFSVRHDRFMMYPTFFHQKVEELAPRLRGMLDSTPNEAAISLEYFANVRGVWKVQDLDLLSHIEGEHGMSWEAVVSRFNYKNRPGVHVVAVELMRLPAPVAIVETPRYRGCVSWVRLDEPVDLSGARSACNPDLVRERVEYLKSMLGAPSPQESL